MTTADRRLEQQKIENYRLLSRRIHELVGRMADEPTRFTDFDDERELLAKLAAAVEAARRHLG